VSVEYEIPKTTSDCQFIDYKSAILTDVSDNEDKDDYYADKRKPNVSVFIEPPSPCDRLRALRGSEYYRRHSSHLPSSLGAPRESMENMRRHSNHNPNLINIDPEHAKYLNSSPAASRRISCGTLFKSGERLTFGSARNIFSSRKSISKHNAIESEERKKEETKAKTLPIINPLVRLPSWPNVNVQSGTGFISKCLLANADTLCSLACPLMDPDETLLEGFYERSVMNNYFGIGIDAKISLDFHMKREEHPEKCRSRAKNYMWYGVLGSKQWLQKTYKNLEQRVQLECDGQRIPLPSLQGIVILNIPSFMGGTNFWGGRKEDDIFLAPSFDDRILEVVAVFGSVQMAACRLINVQHHRIAQCQSVQINILGNFWKLF
jgi:diacylglycerol kinase (ATP)